MNMEGTWHVLMIMGTLLCTLLVNGECIVYVLCCFTGIVVLTVQFNACRGKAEVAKFLIRVVPSAVDADECGCTPLHGAAFAGSVDTCRALLDAGANVNAQDRACMDLRTPLHKAAEEVGRGGLAAEVMSINTLVGAGCRVMLR